MTTTNTYGRQVVVPLTNKSGGGVIAGDVVIVDTTNNDSFTTTTSGAFTGGIGVAQETIASNAVGRVLLTGYAALVNVNASVTRGNFGKTHTVVKQATDAGSSRIAGTFCQFLTGGTTPDAVVYPVDLGSGTGFTPVISENFLTGDVTMTTAGTGYDGPSLTLGAGTYILHGTVTVSIPSGANINVRLWDGTNTFDDPEQLGAAGQSAISVEGTVVLSGSTTVKITCKTGVNASTIVATGGQYGITNKASHLMAVRLI